MVKDSSIRSSSIIAVAPTSFQARPYQIAGDLSNPEVPPEFNSQLRGLAILPKEIMSSPCLKKGCRRGTGFQPVRMGKMPMPHVSPLRLRISKSLVSFFPILCYGRQIQGQNRVALWQLGRN